MDLEENLKRVEKWIVDHDYRGYEPFDGNSSPFHALTFNHVFLERVLQQIVLRSPFHIRPILGVRPQPSTKGRGFIAWGHILRFKETNDGYHKDRARESLQWLIESTCPRYDEFSWGNHFHYASRGGKIPIHEPTIVWTSLIGYAFLEAFETFQDEQYLDVAKSVCRWILDLDLNKTDRGTCIAYTKTGGQGTIHNSSMLGAAMLAWTAKHTGDTSALPLAKEAMTYSCARQLDDGAWYYGGDQTYHWIDCFHTGYNLDSLNRYIEYSGDQDFAENLDRGFEYFKRTFFDPSTGRPNYYHDETYPIDIQCASQGIDTLALFGAKDPDSLRLARKVAEWTCRNMQERDGGFCYRILKWKKVHAKMIHWGQGTMFKGLAHLLLREREAR